MKFKSAMDDEEEEEEDEDDEPLCPSAFLKTTTSAREEGEEEDVGERKCSRIRRPTARSNRDRDNNNIIIKRVSSESTTFSSQ